jgi:hypothetical protein
MPKYEAIFDQIANGSLKWNAAALRALMILLQSSDKERRAQQPVEKQSEEAFKSIAALLDQFAALKADHEPKSAPREIPSNDVSERPIAPALEEIISIGNVRFRRSK